MRFKFRLRKKGKTEAEVSLRADLDPADDVYSAHHRDAGILADGF